MYVDVRELVFQLGINAWPSPLPGVWFIPLPSSLAQEAWRLIASNAAASIAWGAYALFIAMIMRRSIRTFQLRGTTYRRHKYDVPPYAQEMALRAAWLSLWTLPLWALLPWKVAAPPIVAYWLTFSDRSEFDGRRRWPSIRDWPLMRILQRRMGARLVVLDKLDADGQYLFACHPHGILPLGCISALATNSVARPLKVQAPGIDKRLFICAASFCFYVPFVRDFFMWLGVCDVSWPHVDRHLERGHHVALFPGGGFESIYASADRRQYPTLRLKSRKGFVRLAMKHGVDLVPVYTFGEIQAWRLYREPIFFVDHLIGSFQRASGIYLPILLNLLPRKVVTTTVVGEPLRVGAPNPAPTDAEVDALHAAYVRALKALHSRHRKSGEKPFDEGALVVF